MPSSEGFRGTRLPPSQATVAHCRSPSGQEIARGVVVGMFARRSGTSRRGQVPRTWSNRSGTQCGLNPGNSGRGAPMPGPDRPGWPVRRSAGRGRRPRTHAVSRRLQTSEEGIGKSRLAREVSGYAASRGLPTAWDRAGDSGTPDPFRHSRLVSSALRQIGDRPCRQLDPYRPVLARFAPEPTLAPRPRRHRPCSPTGS